jgi:hypothetical protein
LASRADNTPSGSYPRFLHITDDVSYGSHNPAQRGIPARRKAIDCVSRWEFKPGMKDGQPMNVAASIEVTFRVRQALP